MCSVLIIFLSLIIEYPLMIKILDNPIMQMSELADIAKCAADAIPGDDQSIPFLLSCLEDLRVVIDRRKFDALTVETFGTRIEKLIR